MKSPIARTGEQLPSTGKGHGIESLGPSDLSDTGSDMQGIPHRRLTDVDWDSDTDFTGTGERAGVDRQVLSNGDILPDHIIDQNGKDQGAYIADEDSNQVLFSEGSDVDEETGEEEY